MSGRLLVNIAYRHLDPVHHSRDCTDEECGRDCPVRKFSEVLAEPVLASEVQAEREHLQRLEALAAAANAA